MSSPHSLPQGPSSSMRSSPGSTRQYVLASGFTSLSQCTASGRLAARSHRPRQVEEDVFLRRPPCSSPAPPLHSALSCFSGTSRGRPVTCCPARESLVPASKLGLGPPRCAGVPQQPVRRSRYTPGHPGGLSNQWAGLLNPVGQDYEGFCQGCEEPLRGTSYRPS
ncbi:hypothetical protein NDU88_006603 [Pleurodeles waltl]|uniref:Uncharacterized protein n=1 Tax=Pleurodeles waltl TaxID=8319 RepID=A0AAV7MCQ6_PLEWA|nr:hypothetical protein NDU88_006603 [Pleurodeles waltl]